MRSKAVFGALALSLVAFGLGVMPLAGSARAGARAERVARAAGDSAAPAGVTDRVRLGVASDERTHGLQASGSSRASAGTVEAGQLTEAYTARSVSAGARFSVRLHVSPRQPLTVQLQEVRPNADWGKAYGFRVLLDGVPSYVRPADEPDAGGGPYVSEFVDTADPGITGDGVVTVTVEGSSAESAYLQGIWAYSDLPRMADEQGMQAPDRMVFALGQDYLGESVFRQKLDYITSQVHGNSDIPLGMAVLDYYPKRTTAQLAQNYALWSKLSQAYALPFAIESTTDWEGTPTGVSDGKGGTFDDLKYQQILWSPQDTTGRDKDVWKGQSLKDLLGDRYDPHYGLSVPNIWGNTPWLTWHDPDLNAFYARKLTDSIDAFEPLFTSLQSSGQGSAVLPFSTTMESTYWSKRDGKGVADQRFTAYNNGVERRDLYADYNPSTVAAAEKDGVTLDPTDGLSDAEKHWLYKNQSYLQQFFADLYYAKLPRERITVDSDGTHYPADELRQNVFSEVYSRLQEPYWSGVYPGTTQGILRHARPGSEFIELDDYSPGGFSHLQRQREFGRIANPNLEDSVSGPAGKLFLLRELHINGSRYSTLYNWASSGDNAAAGWINEFVANQHPYDLNRSTPPDGRIVNQARVSTTFTAGDLGLADSVDVRVERTGTPHPLQLELRDENGRTIGIRRLSAAEIPNSGWASFGFPVQQLTKGKAYTIDIRQVGGDPAYAFPTTAGELAARVGLDMPTERDKSLTIQWRRDAADAIANVTQDAGSADDRSRATLDAASRALTRNRYVEAYRLAIRADSLRFPIPFQIEGSGHVAGSETLGPFPIGVASSSGVDIDLESYASGRAAQLRVQAYRPGVTTLRFDGFGKGTTATLDGTALQSSTAGNATTIRLEPADTAAHTLVVRYPGAP